MIDSIVKKLKIWVIVVKDENQAHVKSDDKDENGEKCVDLLSKMIYKVKVMKMSGVVYWASQLKALMTFKNNLY